MTEQDHDQVCKCGARYGEHGAPVSYCPAGRGRFNRKRRFVGTSEYRPAKPSDRQLIFEAERVGVLPIRERVTQQDPRTGEDVTIGWRLVNRDEIERASRRYREQAKTQPQSQLSLSALLDSIGTTQGEQT